MSQNSQVVSHILQTLLINMKFHDSGTSLQYHSLPSNNFPFKTYFWNIYPLPFIVPHSKIAM